MLEKLGNQLMNVEQLCDTIEFESVQLEVQFILSSCPLISSRHHLIHLARLSHLCTILFISASLISSLHHLFILTIRRHL